jgi:hypothetical protein
MTARILPRAEWPRLADSELGPVLPVLPEDTRIVVVEDLDGTIVGCWAAIRYVHIEGLWVAPAHRRRGRVLGRLAAAMRRVVEAWGAEAALTHAIDPAIADLLRRRGACALPGTAYVVATRALPWTSEVPV